MAANENAALFAQGTQMNVIAQRNGFVVLYPQQSRRNHVAKCWRWHDLVNGSGMVEANTIMRIIRSTVMMHDLRFTKKYMSPAYQQAQQWQAC
ncbi:PHB depolymerase family esterase [Oligella ureolytica]